MFERASIPEAATAQMAFLNGTFCSSRVGTPSASASLAISRARTMAASRIAHLEVGVGLDVLLLEVATPRAASGVVSQ